MPEERKLVTILFADVVDSTSLGDMLDPEDLRVLMSRYYTHAREVILHHGGTVEKFIGDAVMAVFGLLLAYGDDAERTLAAALALRSVVVEDAILGKRIQLRIGIHTGEVIATSDPSQGDFLVTGDAVNVSSRLQQAAHPGEILVSERTAAGAQAAFLFGDQRVLQIKGKREPLRGFPLQEARTIRQVGRPPFVGRQLDLQYLSVLMMRAEAERQPQVISIVAPAGTGKTRLLEEFVTLLKREDGFRVAVARCLPYGQTLTYWPLRGLLTDILGREITRAAVSDVFMRGGQEPRDVARLTDVVQATLGIDGDGRADRESIFAAWKLLFEIYFHETSHLLVFEDMQWASESLLDLVDYLTQPQTPALLRIVILSRPELFDRRPGWGEGGQHFTSLTLLPLPDAQMEKLVGSLAKGITEATREQIVQRSTGNPFFAMELVRELADRRLAGEATPPDSLPDTVHAAVLARLDRLSFVERTVMQIASVAGRSFQREMLQFVLHHPQPVEITRALDTLLSRDLIAQAPHGTYTFHHILIRDVAYGTLTRAERMRMHVKIATWLEHEADDQRDTFTELMAFHYREAVHLSHQSAVPQPLPFDAAHVVSQLERAAERASRSGAFVEVYSDLQCALEIASPPAFIRLYEKLGDSIVFSDAAADAYRQAMAYWRQSDMREPLLGARLLRKLLTGYIRFRPWVSMLPTTEEMQTMRAEAQQFAEEAGDEDEHLRIRVVNLTWWPYSYWTEEITPQEAEAGRAIALAAAAHFEAREAWTDYSMALDGYAALSWKLGRYRDALTASQRRYQAPVIPASERGDALAAIVFAYAELGDVDRSIAIVRESLMQMRPGEPIEHLSIGMGAAAWVAWIRGQWSVLDELLAFLTGVWKRIQYVPTTTITLAEGYWVAFLLAMAREDRPAAQAAASVITHVTPQGMVNSRTLLNALLEGDLSHLQVNGEYGEMGPGLLMCLNEWDVEFPPNARERARSSQGVSTDHVAEIADALSSHDAMKLEVAIDRAEMAGLIPHAARMRIVLAQRLKSLDPLIRARPVLEQLGDRQFLRRLEEVEAQLRKGQA